METAQNGVRYDIRIPGDALAGLRRTLTWPFTARATAREREEAYTTLPER